MLSELAVRHFAIIRELQVSFQPGFNLLSGETGAGKSILVGAVNLIMGGRASQEMIRTGSDEANVEALFDLSQHSVTREILQELGLAPAAELLIRRTISRSGRNRVQANGQLLTLQQLQLIAGSLLSISGQHEHQRLLDPDTHLGLLDAAGSLEPEVQEVAASYGACAGTQDKLQKLRRSGQERAAKRELTEFQLRELETAGLKADEDVELERERKLLQHAATLAEATESAFSALYDKRGAVLEELARVRNHLETLSRIDSDQQPLLNHLAQASLHLEELAHALQQYSRGIQFDPERLTAIEDRLATIQRLTKKYGGRVSDLLVRIEALRSDLSEGESFEIQERELESELLELRRNYLEQALALSRRRRETAEQLASSVQNTLAALDMPQARFAVRFARDWENDPEQDPVFSPTGLDEVEFLLSANPGEDLKPLVRVASGGELSRILLALKSLLGVKGQAETLIFDEVDAGIGGRTAELVGLQLQKLAARHQVICITHLPQIACYAAHHYRVAKATDGTETTATIRALAGQERVEELARMLGGVSISAKTLAHAREMLETASQRKS